MIKVHVNWEAIPCIVFAIIDKLHDNCVGV